MGRPPNASSANSPSRSLPSHHGSSSASRSKHFRQFVIPIPPTPLTVAKAIRSHCSGTGGSNSRHPTKRIRALRTKLADQRAKIETNQTKLRRREEDKERALRKLHVQHQANTAQAVAAVETALRQQHATEAAERRTAFETQLDADCATQRATWQAERTALDTKPLEQRIALLEQAASSTNDEDSSACGAIAALCQPAMDAVDCSESKRLQAVHEEQQRDMEKLTEARSELIWLLKQVIKAEEKQKAQLKAAADKVANGK